jgi:hypothetical protein
MSIPPVRFRIEGNYDDVELVGSIKLVGDVLTDADCHMLEASLAIVAKNEMVTFHCDNSRRGQWCDKAHQVLGSVIQHLKAQGVTVTENAAQA